MATQDTGKPNKVALWCVPRTLSSVFCKSIAEIADSQVIFEYFVAAFHSGPENTILHPNTPKGMIPEPNFSNKWVKEQMEAETPGIKLYFVKDMAYAVGGDFTRLPDGYQHTFLMRHPARVFKSHELTIRSTGIAKMTTFLPKGYAYKELFELYEYVTKELKQEAVVLDADDLKANPKAMMQRYCKATDIPFQDSMLSWQPETPNPSGWKAPLTCWIGNQMFGIYKAALESSEFKAGEPAPISMEELSEDVKDCIEFSMPYYEKLREVCMKP